MTALCIKETTNLPSNTREQNYILEGQKLSDLTLNGSFKNTSLIKPQRSWLLEGLQVPSPLFYGETTFCRLLRMFRQFTIVLTLAFYWCKILIRPTILSSRQLYQPSWQLPIKVSKVLFQSVIKYILVKSGNAFSYSLIIHSWMESTFLLTLNTNGGEYP